MPTSSWAADVLPPRPPVTTALSLVAVIDDADPESAADAFEARRHSAKERPVRVPADPAIATIARTPGPGRRSR
jgi:hypothetical protein